MHYARWLVVVFCAICAAASAGAADDETRIDRADLPVAVEQTVARESAVGRLRGLSREIENGKVYYEAEIVVDGHSKDFLIDELGTVMEIEEEIPLASLPAPVRDALVARAGRGTIVGVESVTRDGAVTGYEADIRTGRRHAEVRIEPDGRVLEPSR